VAALHDLVVIDEIGIGPISSAPLWVTAPAAIETNAATVSGVDRVGVGSRGPRLGASGRPLWKGVTG
jgi:hypothetical protein